MGSKKSTKTAGEKRSLQEPEVGQFVLLCKYHMHNVFAVTLLASLITVA